MNNIIRLMSPCKINLSLDVTGVRADGYHLLRTVMHTVNLCDVVTIELGGKGLSVGCSMPGVPTGSENIAYKAAKAYFEAIGQPNLTARIYIEKRIPFQAGLAGGSTNAAAVLRGLELLTRSGLSEAAMHELAIGLGADVPFLLTGGCALAEGIGEILTPQPLLPDCHIVVAKPSLGIRTRDAFTLYDRHGPGGHPDTQGILSSLATGDVQGVAGRMKNILYEVAPQDQIEGFLEIMRKHGAQGSLMSGSGSAVFGIFTDGEKALECHRELMKYAPFVVMTAPCANSPIVLP